MRVMDGDSGKSMEDEEETDIVREESEVETGARWSERNCKFVSEMR